jgi:hypothetical protein
MRHSRSFTSRLLASSAVAVLLAVVGASSASAGGETSGNYHCPEIWQTSAGVRAYGSGTIILRAPGAVTSWDAGWAYSYRVERATVYKEGYWEAYASKVLLHNGTYGYCNQVR